MSTFELRAEPRSVVGKKVRFLRRQGIVPGNIYGHAASTAIQIPARDVEQTIHRAGRTQLVSLAVKGSEPTTVLVKGWQRHPYKGNLLHVDFYRVMMTETLRMDVPIRVTGEAPAVEADWRHAVPAAGDAERRVPSGRHSGGDRGRHRRPRRGRCQHLRARPRRTFGGHHHHRWRRDGREDPGAHGRAGRGGARRGCRRRGRGRGRAAPRPQQQPRRAPGRVLSRSPFQTVLLPIAKPRARARGFALFDRHWSGISPAEAHPAQRAVVLTG